MRSLGECVKSGSLRTALTARVLRDGKWFIAFSSELPEGSGQGLTEEEALESIREFIPLFI